MLNIFRGGVCIIPPPPMYFFFGGGGGIEANHDYNDFSPISVAGVIWRDDRRNKRRPHSGCNSIIHGRISHLIKSSAIIFKNSVFEHSVSNTYYPCRKSSNSTPKQLIYNLIFELLLEGEVGRGGRLNWVRLSWVRKDCENTSLNQIRYGFQIQKYMVNFCLNDQAYNCLIHFSSCIIING